MEMHLYKSSDPLLFPTGEHQEIYMNLNHKRPNHSDECHLEVCLVLGRVDRQLLATVATGLSF